MASTADRAAFHQLTELAPRHVEDLVSMYAEEWWTNTRTIDDVRLMLDHTSLLVALEERGTERLGASARVVTDRVYHGTLLDVIVRSDLRGRGLGDRLMDLVLTDPALVRLRSLALVCREDKVAFYERWGFEVRSWRPAIGEFGRGAEMSRRLAAANQ